MYVWIGVNVWLDGLWWLVRGGGGQKIEILLPESPKNTHVSYQRFTNYPPEITQTKL